MFSRKYFFSESESDWSKKWSKIIFSESESDWSKIYFSESESKGSQHSWSRTESIVQKQGHYIPESNDENILGRISEFFLGK